MGGLVGSFFQLAYDPSQARVLQCVDTDGAIRGESFWFEGQRKPQTEQFKKRCRAYYPDARFKKLRSASDAVGCHTWVAEDFFSDGYTPGHYMAPRELVEKAAALVNEWMKNEEFSGEMAHMWLSLAARVLLGTEIEVVSTSDGEQKAAKLVRLGIVRPDAIKIV